MQLIAIWLKIEIVITDLSSANYGARPGGVADRIIAIRGAISAALPYRAIHRPARDIRKTNRPRVIESAVMRHSK